MQESPVWGILMFDAHSVTTTHFRSGEMPGLPTFTEPNKHASERVKLLSSFNAVPKLCYSLLAILAV